LSSDQDFFNISLESEVPLTTRRHIISLPFRLQASLALKEA